MAKELENLFNAYKVHGMFSEYADYNAYRADKFGISKSPEKEENESFKRWHSELPPDEKAEFDFCFKDND